MWAFLPDDVLFHLRGGHEQINLLHVHFHPAKKLIGFHRCQELPSRRSTFFSPVVRTSNKNIGIAIAEVLVKSNCKQSFAPSDWKRIAQSLMVATHSFLDVVRHVCGSKPNRYLLGVGKPPYSFGPFKNGLGGLSGAITGV